MDRLISSVVVLLFLGFVCMAYDNVYRDINPIRARAERVACATRDCTQPHKLTQIERNVLGQTLTFRWDAAIVNVQCRRSWFAIGARKCTAI